MHETSLLEQLNLHNHRGISPVNSCFQKWSQHVTYCLNNREDGEDERYKKSIDKMLLKQCRKHALQHQQGMQKDYTLMLVHPFYLHLSHFNQIKQSTILDETHNYLTTLLKVL